jgi:hypothetical protein
MCGEDIHVRLTHVKLISILIALAGVAWAQRGAPAPALMECGTHGDVEILCGTHSPEDLELTPDGKYLIVSQFVNGRGGGTPGLVLLDLAKKTYSPIPITAEPRKDWGDPACPGPVNDKMVPHGISLGKRTAGSTQLYVVNHGGRQSIEMFELKQTGGNWTLAWHGCAVTMAEFNDVAVLPDGGFIATHPTSLTNADLFGGKPTGVVARWTQAKGEVTLPGSEGAYPNGVLVSDDGKTMYFNAWTAMEVHKYDLESSKETGVVKLDFMPDNITWTRDHKMLAAGVKNARGNCPGDSATPCVSQFGVAEIDPARMTSTTVFDSLGQGALISGVSVALQVDDAIYVGAFQGDRLVKIGWKK